MRRLIWAASAAALLLVATGCETIRPTGPPSTRTPVIFVHGWNADETMWDTAVSTFESAGYSSGDITVPYYNSGVSAQEAAVTLAAEVDHLRAYTGKAKVDMAGQTPTIANLQAAWPQIAAQGVEVEVQWSANDGVIIPAANSQNPSPATNVEVNSSLGHLDIPNDPTVLAETIDFFAH